MLCLDSCNGLYYGISEKLLNQTFCTKSVMKKFKHDQLGKDWLNIHTNQLFSKLDFKPINH